MIQIYLPWTFLRRIRCFFRNSSLTRSNAKSTAGPQRSRSNGESVNKYSGDQSYTWIKRHQIVMNSIYTQMRCHQHTNVVIFKFLFVCQNHGPFVITPIELKLCVESNSSIVWVISKILIIVIIIKSQFRCSHTPATQQYAEYHSITSKFVHFICLFYLKIILCWFKYLYKERIRFYVIFTYIFSADMLKHFLLRDIYCYHILATNFIDCAHRTYKLLRIYIAIAA